MSRLGRPLFIAMRAPAFADRRGLRWLLSDRIWPAPLVVLRHRGRRSGRLYATPVEAIVDDREHGRIVVSPMRGEEGDWYRNVVAGGLVEVALGGRRFAADWRELPEEERLSATREYVRDHPRYAPLVLRSLMRLHGLRGDPVDEVARGLPMIALEIRPEPGQEGSAPEAAASRRSGAGR
jgi:deazaflavin-dependent oxidoreductase (nitroreductase family)